MHQMGVSFVNFLISKDTWYELMNPKQKELYLPGSSLHFRLSIEETKTVGVQSKGT